MNGRHIQIGLLFVVACVLIGLGLAFFSTHHVSIDSGNTSVPAGNVSSPAPAATPPVATTTQATDFLVTEELRSHPPTFETVGEGPTGISFCAGDPAKLTNGSARRLNLKVVGAESDFADPLGSVAVGQLLKFDAGDVGTWNIINADDGSPLFQYEVTDCSHPTAHATLAPTATPTAVAEEPKQGRCRLTVGGQKYLDGQCFYATRDDGSFGVSDATGRTRLAAFLEQSADGAAARWTGPRGGSNLDQSLGPMTQEGACWSNYVAEVCLWEK